MWMCITIDGKNYDVTLHDFKTFANDHLGDAIFLQLCFCHQKVTKFCSIFFLGNFL